MLSHAMIADEVRRQEQFVSASQGKGDVAYQPTALREEVYQLEVTDRELLYGDSFLSEWGRMSNYSPDDFE